MSVLLETKGVGKAFGAFPALADVSIAIRADELVAVVGPNGAGKTTLVNLLTGLLRPTAGEILFRGRNIAGVGPVRVVQHPGQRLLDRLGPTVLLGEERASPTSGQLGQRVPAELGESREVGPVGPPRPLPHQLPGACSWAMRLRTVLRPLVATS